MTILTRFGDWGALLLIMGLALVLVMSGGKR